VRVILTAIWILQYYIIPAGVIEQRHLKLKLMKALHSYRQIVVYGLNLDTAMKSGMHLRGFDDLPGEAEIGNGGKELLEIYGLHNIGICLKVERLQVALAFF
jgi:hypothetical protein